MKVAACEVRIYLSPEDTDRLDRLCVETKQVRQTLLRRWVGERLRLESERQGKGATGWSHDGSVFINNEQGPTDEQMIEQFVRDLYEAHAEILKLQGCVDVQSYDWPEWSSPANSIRWAEQRLGRRLAKTTLWTAHPPLCRCPPLECLLHPNLATCGLRRAPLPAPPETP